MGSGDKAQEQEKHNRSKTRSVLCVVCHDCKELLFVDLAILVKVELVYHGLSAKGRCTYISARSPQCPKGRRGTTEKDVKSEKIGFTYNSSSSNRSPISFATRRRFRSVIFPVLSSSKSWKARLISSIGSRAKMRSFTITWGNRNRCQ